MVAKGGSGHGVTCVALCGSRCLKKSMTDDEPNFQLTNQISSIAIHSALSKSSCNFARQPATNIERTIPGVPA